MDIYEYIFMDKSVKTWTLHFKKMDYSLDNNLRTLPDIGMILMQ